MSISSELSALLSLAEAAAAGGDGEWASVDNSTSCLRVESSVDSSSATTVLALWAGDGGLPRCRPPSLSCRCCAGRASAGPVRSVQHD